YDVYCSDLYSRTYVESGKYFLTEYCKDGNLVTNPLCNSAEGFVKAGGEKADRKLALLLRLAFLEGSNRNRTIFSVVPPTTVWVFSERITFYPSGAARAGSGTTAYAWFVWDKQHLGQTQLRWLSPGFKALYK